MPYYIVKATQEKGCLRPPIVANFPSKKEAIEAVKLMLHETDQVEIKGIRDDIMRAAFGEQPEGTATFRSDWTWRGENDDKAEPY